MAQYYPILLVRNNYNTKANMAGIDSLSKLFGRLYNQQL
jgi:hypothetical protein